ncbi:hypothetical protein DAPPUDRAFT_245545 [Daphnia pulex]|uniref:Uncharacterized protein n=1 Tax=Daphnia pulex TaxID=6669 RepID=E9GNK3_DAPPU|nr:hypothetical protein DAPPUDRAFT_245545 [Daphnia pulex]|eukprot:EFX78947.1 hypothetical protein DAPPUDRAFT_245545 [Daphnia pulex]
MPTDPPCQLAPLSPTLELQCDADGVFQVTDNGAGPDYNIHGRSSLSQLVQNIVGRSLIRWKFFSHGLIFILSWLYIVIDAGPDYNIHGRSSLSQLVRNIVGRSLIRWQILFYELIPISAIPIAEGTDIPSMPRCRNSELSRELRRSVLEERQLAATIERELARQRRRVVHQEPYRRVEFRPVARPYVPPKHQPQQYVEHGGSVPPPPLGADEPPAQRPEIAALVHDPGVVAHGLATARLTPAIHSAQASADDTLQLAIDEETPFNE